MSEFDYSALGVASQWVDAYGAQGADMSGLLMVQLAGWLIIGIGHMIIPYVLMAVWQYMLGQKLGMKNNWQAWVPNAYYDVDIGDCV